MYEGKIALSRISSPYSVKLSSLPRIGANPAPSYFPRLDASLFPTPLLRDWGTAVYTLSTSENKYNHGGDGKQSDCHRDGRLL